jgi:hypothetical protein
MDSTNQELVMVLQDNTQLDTHHDPVKLYLFEAPLDDDTVHMIDHSLLKKQASPLLPATIASVVSSISWASRKSLRLSSFTVSTLFDGLKFSAAALLGLGELSIFS